MPDTRSRRLPFFDRADLIPFDHDKFAALRAERALIKFTGAPMTWGVTRHADMAALLRDKRIGHRFPAPMVAYEFGTGPAGDYVMNSVQNRDGADHARLRGLMTKAITPTRVRRLRSRIDAVVDGVLDGVLERGTFDVVDDLAVPLPLALMCDLLGIEHIDVHDVRRGWYEALSADQAVADPAVERLREHMGQILAMRQPDSGGRILDRLLAAEDGEDGLSHAEVVDNALELFFAGFETPSNLIANGIDTFLDHPDQWQRLVEDPSLATTAVDEILRYAGPVPFKHRITLEPIELGGRTLPSGTMLVLLFAAGNRDPDVFDDPDRFDIGRHPNPHLAFGGGPHYCLGAQLARLEGEIVFRKVAERLPVLRRVAPVDRHPYYTREIRHLAVTVSERTRQEATAVIGSDE
jgi:cytochrome P450